MPAWKRNSSDQKLASHFNKPGNATLVRVFFFLDRLTPARQNIRQECSQFVRYFTAVF